MSTLNENLRPKDLVHLVHTTIHIDEFQSKMGEDADIIVVNFKIKDKEPAIDLVDFIEKSYEFVLDGDVSAGEMMDGSYLVFVELERKPKSVDHILKMINELEKLTDHKMSDWSFCYGKDEAKHLLTSDNISKYVPLTPHQYRSRYGSDELDEMRTIAGLPIRTSVPNNPLTEMLQVAAGIK